ncbi:MAG TPA: SDR family NAD(P)-dependent oxidoreductase [Methylomirabilota bacterium]|nr:SDR family NAD(P)-dependent oxidoreductase [Methylomirabilota bacterium]
MMLAGRVALVTGASHGTGVDIARALAAEGARVAVHYRSDRAAAEVLASAIRAGGGVAEAFAADVARSEEVRRLMAEVELRLGALGIVVNNAGPFNDTAFSELAEADWDYVMNANLKAVYLTSQLAAPGMRRAGWGRIVNIGATSGLVRSHGVYGLAKAALLPLTQALALELAPAVTVNAVVPSQIASARTDRMAAYKAAAIAGTPLGRLVTQAEIGQMVLRLCSPEFDFVTGQAIVMDGGRVIPRFPRLNLSSE